MDINKRLLPLILPNNNPDNFMVWASLNTFFLYQTIVFFDRQYNLEYSCFDQFAIMAGMMADGGYSPAY